MRFDIITLFPELFAAFMQSGINRRAFEARQDGTKLLDLRFVNPRDYADGNYRRIDDRPFGGGPGMVMMAEPLARCVEAVQAQRAGQSSSHDAQERAAACPIVLFSPMGPTLNHAQVQHWSDSQGAILICGRYEGLDQRFIDRFVTHQISLGDFVLSGGEIAAMALLDAVARLQPGVLGDADSHAQDSFNPAVQGLLDCQHYTRPEVWRDQSVPEVLLSGNHAQIERWRSEQRRNLTRQLRPDLL
jgi:tRNA (guanine37-N1)-methyltransferase